MDNLENIIKIVQTRYYKATIEILYGFYHTNRENAEPPTTKYIFQIFLNIKSLKYLKIARRQLLKYIRFTERCNRYLGSNIFELQNVLSWNQNDGNKFILRSICLKISPHCCPPEMEKNSF